MSDDARSYIDRMKYLPPQLRAAFKSMTSVDGELELFLWIRGGRWHPSNRVLAGWLRDYDQPIPEDIRQYIAGRLDGTIKVPRTRGRPVKDKIEARLSAHHWRRLWLSNRVQRWHRVLEHPRYAREWKRKHGRELPASDAYRAALDRVAEETGVPPDTLDKYVYPRR